MADMTKSARPWKLATFSFAGVSVVLAVLLVLQASGRFDLLGVLSSGGAGGYSHGSGPAPVKLGEFKGSDALSSAFKDSMGKRLASTTDLRYSAPGVTGVVVGGAVKDAKVTTAGGATTVEVKVSLYVTKEPGAGILSVLSSTAALEADGTPSPASIESYKKEAMDAAAEAVYADLREVLK